MLILIIGLGSIAKKHIFAIRKVLPNAEICALRHTKNANIVEGVTNLSSLEELNSIPYFIIISNPTSEHFNTILKVAQLKSPLFIEKPVFNNLDYENKIVDVIKSNNILTYVACNLRFHPVIQYLKEFEISSKKINEINVYCGSYLPNWRPGSNFKNIYSSIKELGGGVDLDLIHEIDYIYWLFGQPLDTLAVKRNVSTLGIETVDFASYTLVYDKFCINVILNYYRIDTKRTIEILMEDDTLFCDLINNSIYSHNNKLIINDKSYNINDTYVNQMKYFVKCIDNNFNKTFNDVFDGINTLKIALNNVK